ncbi:MAG: diaminopimelate decarboxylase [Christensenellaceae bacterium]|jgi:diaminopimelate decarboxylase
MKKEPFLTLAEVQEIAKEYPTPFHIYDEQGIFNTLQNIKKAFSWNKGFQEYFAVKATPTPAILQIIKDAGCGLDCSSYTELMLAEALGFSGDDIMLSANVAPDEDYLLAHKLGAIINLDDFTDIDHVASLFPLPKTMSLRFNPGGLFAIGNDIMDHPEDAKYGMTKEQLIKGIKKMMGYGVEHFGIHAFLASNTITNEYYPTLAGMLFEVAVEVQKETNADISFINLSGGIGIPYRPEDTPNDIFKIGAAVKEEYDRILTPAGMGNLSIFTELGRFVTGPSGALVTQAVHEKHIYKDYIGVDACAANLMRPAMYGAYHHITVLGKEDAPHTKTYDITGGLCENNDKFAIDRSLPEIEIGDYLLIHDTGAHGFSMGYNYNGKLRSAELLKKTDGSIALIRRAETPVDYFATFDFLNIF